MSGRTARRGPRGMAVSVLAAMGAIAACGDPTATPRGLPASFESPERGPAGLALLRSATAVGYTGPEDHPFAVRLRTPALELYPCVSCHDAPVTPGGRGTEEHADVQPAHPEALVERCEACHSPADPGVLTLQNGDTAPLDEAYRLCAQCHYLQADAWAGGAHGKRLVGWRGARVVMSCTECHDPHAPTFAPRIPFRGPNIPRTGGTDR